MNVPFPISFQTNLKRFDAKAENSLFRGIKRGFEKESLRVDAEGNMAKTLHPKALGASLTHPFITTDYSEALLELITPPTADLKEPFQMLTELHAFTYAALQDEMLWNASMPCKLPKEEDIPIAEYGHSNIGKLKHIYRKGLGKRYSRTMQTIAGIHYNFSLPETFFQVLYQNHSAAVKSEAANSETASLSLKDFISEQYLALIRNSLRWSWLLPLLFGATPAICAGFLNPNSKIAKQLLPLDKNTFYGPHATSLRLSDLGYHNKEEAGMLVSYNSFPEFLQTMHKAVHTTDPNFAKFGIKIGDDYQQLNDSILQTEDEHYAMVRPKRVSLPGERTLSALMRDGIEYIEVRALDINPFIPIGIEPRTVFILDAFLITCLFLESPPLDEIEINRIQANLSQVVIDGRDTTLEITNNKGQKENALNLAQHFLSLMQPVALALDKAYGIDHFSLACSSAKKSLNNIESLPSARMIQEMKNKNWSYFDFAKYWSIQHKNYFKHLPFSEKLVQYYESLAKTSLKLQEDMENGDKLPFSEFLAHFLAP